MKELYWMNLDYQEEEYSHAIYFNTLNLRSRFHNQWIHLQWKNYFL